MDFLTDTIAGKQVERHFVTMQEQYQQGRHVTVRKTQVIVEGVILCTLSGWDSDDNFTFLKRLERVNAYNSKTGKFNL